MESVEYLVSAPVPVRWSGWESTTYRLQQCGWSLSVREDQPADTPSPSLRLSMHHRDMDISAMTTPMRLDRTAFRWTGTDLALREMFGYVMNTGFDVAWMSVCGHVHVHMSERPDFFSGFAPIDATPQIKVVERLEDVVVFDTPVLGGAAEVVVREADVGELLTMILERQEPEAQARYEAAVKKKRRIKRRARLQAVTLEVA